jgi:hypothetical protein
MSTNPQQPGKRMSNTIIVDLSSLTTNNVELSIAPDALGGLIVCWNSQVLPDKESLLVLVPSGEVFNFVISDFGPAAARWTVSASPRINDATQSWLRGEETATESCTDEWPHPDFLDVTIEAQADGVPPKKKKIQIKIRKEIPMPPRRGFKRD